MTAQRGLRGIHFLVIALSLVPILAAQMARSKDAANGNPPSVFVLRKNVRRVIVDVVVRDSNNQPVRGLLAKDFSVSEDGKSQRIASFEAHEFDTPSISLPRNAPLPPNVFVNVPKVPEHGPLYVILYDMVNMEMDDQAYARQQVMKFIPTIPEGARFAVYVHSDGLHFVQGFTEDRDLIYAALDPNHSNVHVPRSFLYSRNFNRGDPVAMVSVLTHIGEFLEGIPGKKNLIWMAGSFPVTLYAHEGDPRDLEDDLRAELNALARAEVAVYPVNIRGVIVNPEGAMNGAGAHTGVGGVPGGTPGPAIDSAVRPVGPSGDSVYQDYMMQDEIATATGGRAFYSDNGIKEVLDEAVADGGNYYSITYSPANLNYDGSLRRIKVVLDQHGYHLAYRRSYYADDPDAAKPHTKSSPDEDAPGQIEAKAQERPMFASLQHGAPLVHQLIFKARIHPEGLPRLATAEEMAKLAGERTFSSGRRKNSKPLKPVPVQSYAIYYAVVASQIKVPQDGAIPLEFAAVAYDADGFIANAVLENVVEDSASHPFSGLQPTVPEAWEPTNQKVYRAMQELEVPVNATTLRLAVRDTSTDRLGAMEIPLPLAAEPQVRATNPPASLAKPGSATKLN